MDVYAYSTLQFLHYTLYITLFILHKSLLNYRLHLSNLNEEYERFKVNDITTIT